MNPQVEFGRAECEESATDLLNEENVESWPVRVDQIAKHKAIKVRYSPMDEDLSGMAFYKDGIPIIGVNSRHHINRQRFTIAHELGHFRLHDEILKKGMHVDKVITVLNRDDEAATGNISIEVQANQFAAGLLMPESMVQQYMNEHGLNYGAVQDEKAMEEMANAFKVSQVAMTYRVAKII